jgi:2-succinyl-5-enolpyruvyl-6-hydroxy-3-cyclohexene-1-carboxylate synthase
MRMQLHVDERGAAFFALGHARATGRPAAWLTTSGTAVANGLPAVVEASLDGVPLVLLTADRPPELRDVAANQAIEQPPIFAPYVRWRVDLPPPDPAIDPAFVLTSVDQAVYRAGGTHPGPVHLNAMFRKPLEPRGRESDFAAVDGLGPWASGRSAYTSYAAPGVVPDAGGLVAALRTCERPLIMAGRLGPGEAAAVRELAAETGWPVAADVTSQLLLGPDPVLRHTELLAAHADILPAPDALIEVGRPGVSGRLRTYLASCGARVHAVVADGPTRIDPEHRATHRLEGVLAALAALRAASARRSWAAAWQEADRRVGEALGARFGDGSLSEPSAAWHVSSMIPAEHGLWLASSMPIRDMNAFSSAGQAPRLVAANRGASGIDGTIASAAGLADGLGAPVTLMIGDLAFLHDMNALALLRERPVTLVLVNNDGGGIFSFLPIAEHADVFEPWFTAPHGLTFEAAAGQFDLDHDAPGDSERFRAAYARALASGRGSVIEVRSERGANRRLHSRIAAEASRLVRAR